MERECVSWWLHGTEFHVVGAVFAESQSIWRARWEMEWPMRLFDVLSVCHGRRLSVCVSVRPSRETYLSVSLCTGVRCRHAKCRAARRDICDSCQQSWMSCQPTLVLTLWLNCVCYHLLFLWFEVCQVYCIKNRCFCHRMKWCLNCLDLIDLISFQPSVLVCLNVELTSDSVRCCSSCFNRVVRIVNRAQSGDLVELTDGTWQEARLLLGHNTSHAACIKNRLACDRLPYQSVQNAVLDWRRLTTWNSRSSDGEWKEMIQFELKLSRVGPTSCPTCILTGWPLKCL